MKRRIAQVVLALFILAFVAVVELGLYADDGWRGIGVFNGVLAAWVAGMWALSEVIE